MINQEDLDSLMRAMDNNKDVLVFVDSLPIHKAIKVKRTHDGLTQPQLAALINMGTSTLSEIENGRRRIPYKHEKAIEDYLYHQYWCEGKLLDRIEQ